MDIGNEKWKETKTELKQISQCKPIMIMLMIIIGLHLPILSDLFDVLLNPYLVCIEIIINKNVILGYFNVIKKQCWWVCECTRASVQQKKEKRTGHDFFGCLLLTRIVCLTLFYVI